MLLGSIQETLVSEQARVAIEEVERCPDCARKFAVNDQRHIVVRSLYGKIRIDSPRWLTCLCASPERRTFSPLAAILARRSTPELELVEAKLAAHVSYSEAGRLLNELLPVGRKVHSNEARRHVYAIGRRLDAELAVTGHDGTVRRFGFVPNVDTRPARGE